MTIAPPLTEAAFMAQVTQYAELRGWETFHVRAGRTLDSWRTPGSGTMAKGWPDLVLIRKGRIVFAELKTDGGRETVEQRRVLNLLLGVEHYPHGGTATDVRVELWRPVDWSLVEATLR